MYIEDSRKSKKQLLFLHHPLETAFLHINCSETPPAKCDFISLLHSKRATRSLIIGKHFMAKRILTRAFFSCENEAREVSLFAG